MPDFTSVTPLRLGLFLVLFVPGFISLKVWDLFIASERRDWTKALGEVFGFSALNISTMVPWLLYIYAYRPEMLLVNQRSVWAWVGTSVVWLVVLPALWPLLFLKLFELAWVDQHIINPVQRPWDWVFRARPEYFAVVTLKDGKQIAGMYSERVSPAGVARTPFATSYPVPEQIYLTQVVRLDERGNLAAAVEDSYGVIILSDIRAIEFFVPDPKPAQECSPCQTSESPAESMRAITESEAAAASLRPPEESDRIEPSATPPPADHSTRR